MALLGDEVRFVHDNIRKRAPRVPGLQLFQKRGGGEALRGAKDKMRDCAGMRSRAFCSAVGSSLLELRL